MKAPKVEILGENNTLAGHYAYWVSDEGFKARVNMADPHLVSADPEADEVLSEPRWRRLLIQRRSVTFQKAYNGYWRAPVLGGRMKPKTLKRSAA